MQIGGGIAWDTVSIGKISKQNMVLSSCVCVSHDTAVFFGSRSDEFSIVSAEFMKSMSKPSLFYNPHFWRQLYDESFGFVRGNA